MKEYLDKEFNLLQLWLSHIIYNINFKINFKSFKDHLKHGMYIKFIRKDNERFYTLINKDLDECFTKIKEADEIYFRPRCIQDYRSYLYAPIKKEDLLEYLKLNKI